MSKKFWVIVILSLLFQSGYALDPPTPDFIPNRTLGGSKFHLGFFAGPNYSNVVLSGKYFISDSYLATTDFTFLPHFGLAGIYQHTDKWSFQLELNRETKGMAYTDVLYYPVNGMQLNTQINNQLRLDYWTVPFMAKYHVGRVVMTYFEAGPYFSYLNKATEQGALKIQGISPVSSSIETRNEDFEFSRSAEYTHDYGFAVGWGIIVPLSKGVWGPTTSIYANVRYGQGFRNLYVGREAEELNDVELLIGFEPEEIDPRYEENNIRSQQLTIRFGFVMSI